MANGYAAIELLPSKKGKAIIEARNQDFKGSYLVIDFEDESLMSNSTKVKE
jgi:beta-galactosidase